MTIKLRLNGKKISIDSRYENIPLLWYIREEAGLKGTKFGCGIGQCGACTLHIDEKAVRSCSVPVSSLNGKAITTIEGLARDNNSLHPVQEAWMEIDVPQCGYCQAGQIMSAVALLNTTPSPTDDDIDRGMTNICRCASYVRIRQATKKAADILNASSEKI